MTYSAGRFGRLAFAAVLCGLLLVWTGCGHLAGQQNGDALAAQSRQLDQQAQEIEALRGQVAVLQGQLSRTIEFLKKRFSKPADPSAPPKVAAAEGPKRPGTNAPQPVDRSAGHEEVSEGETAPRPSRPEASSPGEGEPGQSEASSPGEGEPAQPDAPDATRTAAAQPSPESDPDAEEMPDARAEQEAEREARLVEAIPVRAGGVLLPKGRLQFEPQIRYAFSSVNRVEITGYTILPALTLGVIDVTRRQSSSFTTVLGARYGLTNRIELDLGLPFIGGWSSFEISPTNTDGNRSSNLAANGYGIGDLRLGARYQLNQGTGSVPSFVAGLAAQFPTGKNPYEVKRYDAANQFLEKEIPTGSGFFALTPTVSFVYPSEPGVLYGNLRYTWNIEREIDAVQPGVLPVTRYGKIDPGDVIGGSLGMGLSLNDRLSMSLSYDHSVVLLTQQNGVDVSESSPLQIGTLGIGATWRKSPWISYSLMAGIGVTDDAPDVSLSLRIPTSFDLFVD